VPDKRKQTSRINLIRACACLVVLAATIWSVSEFGEKFLSLVAWIETLGAWGPLIFIFAYMVSVPLFAPGSVLTFTAGTLFGLFWGVFYAFVGAFLGSTAAFLISRHIARDWVDNRLTASKHLKAVNEAISDDGLRITLLLRLSPVIPFNALNYFLGLTQVSFRDFVFASTGMIPGTFLYVYFGHFAARVVDSSIKSDNVKLLEWSVWIIGLIATLSAVLLIADKARKKLSVTIDGKEGKF